MTKPKIRKTCPNCAGTGIYSRYTSYTVNGKPICFRCEGLGEIEYKGPLYSKLYKVKTPNGKEKLVKASDRKFYCRDQQNKLELSEIPF